MFNATASARTILIAVDRDTYGHFGDIVEK